MRRIMSLWLPDWPTDRLLRAGRAPASSFGAAASPSPLRGEGRGEGTEAEATQRALGGAGPPARRAARPRPAADRSLPPPPPPPPRGGGGGGWGARSAAPALVRRLPLTLPLPGGERRGKSSGGAP